MTKYPEIEVRLKEIDGCERCPDEWSTCNIPGHQPQVFVPNAWALHGTVRSKLPADAQAEFTADALSGDYRHLLKTVREWVNCV